MVAGVRGRSLRVVAGTDADLRRIVGGWLLNNPLNIRNSRHENIPSYLLVMIKECPSGKHSTLTRMAYTRASHKLCMRGIAQPFSEKMRVSGGAAISTSASTSKVSKAAKTVLESWNELEDEPSGCKLEP